MAQVALMVQVAGAIPMIFIPISQVIFSFKYRFHCCAFFVFFSRICYWPNCCLPSKTGSSSTTNMTPCWRIVRRKICQKKSGKPRGKNMRGRSMDWNFTSSRSFLATTQSQTYSVTRIQPGCRYR